MLTTTRGGSRISRSGGTSMSKGHFSAKIFAEMKELGCWGVGEDPGGTPGFDIDYRLNDNVDNNIEQKYGVL